MNINGIHYQHVNGNIEKESVDHIESLEYHLKAENDEKTRLATDTVQLSQEAYKALREYAPEALEHLEYNPEPSPVLEEAIEIAKEKYFHFGSQYMSIPKTEDEMLSALDIANRYMDALNKIEPDEIYEAIAGANSAGAGSSLAGVSALRDYMTA